MLGHRHTPISSNRTSAALSCTLSPTIGSMSPRDPCIDHNTRIPASHFRKVLATVDNYAARPGSCRKPPGALYTESRKEGHSPFGCRAFEFFSLSCTRESLDHSYVH